MELKILRRVYHFLLFSSLTIKPWWGIHNYDPFHFVARASLNTVFTWFLARFDIIFISLKQKEPITKVSINVTLDFC